MVKLKIGIFGGGRGDGAVSRYKALSIAAKVHCGRIFLSNVLLILYVLSFPLLQLQFCCVIVLNINCFDITFFNLMVSLFSQSTWNSRPCTLGHFIEGSTMSDAKQLCGC